MNDPYDLNRFVRAQQDDYERALSEITSGQKRTHWMWYIFPQLDGLAFSPTAKRYAIKSVEEAQGVPRTSSPRTEAAELRGGSRRCRRPIRGGDLRLSR